MQFLRRLPIQWLSLSLSFPLSHLLLYTTTNTIITSTPHPHPYHPRPTSTIPCVSSRLRGRYISVAPGAEAQDSPSVESAELVTYQQASPSELHLDSAVILSFSPSFSLSVCLWVSVSLSFLCFSVPVICPFALQHAASGQLSVSHACVVQHQGSRRASCWREEPSTCQSEYYYLLLDCCCCCFCYYSLECFVILFWIIVGYNLWGMSGVNADIMWLILIVKSVDSTLFQLLGHASWWEMLFKYVNHFLQQPKTYYIILYYIIYTILLKRHSTSINYNN